MKSRKIVFMVFLSLLAGMPLAHATSYATLHLDSVSSEMREGLAVTFTGQLTSINDTVLSHRTIFIEDDTNYYSRPDIILAITTTDLDGKFSVTWNIVPKDNGNPFHFYAKFLGGNSFGYTRSETYESTIVYHDQSSTDVIPSKTIPIWFKNASEMWYDGQIRDVDYSFSIKNLIDHGVVKSNVSVDDELKFPAWFKNTANWFAENEISNDEYANNLQYLLDNKIIHV